MPSPKPKKTQRRCLLNSRLINRSDMSYGRRVRLTSFRLSFLAAFSAIPSISLPLRSLRSIWADFLLFDSITVLVESSTLAVTLWNSSGDTSLSFFRALVCARFSLPRRELSSIYSNVTKQLYLISKCPKLLKPGLGQGWFWFDTSRTSSLMSIRIGRSWR